MVLFYAVSLYEDLYRMNDKSYPYVFMKLSDSPLRGVLDELNPIANTVFMPYIRKF